MSKEDSLIKLKSVSKFYYNKGMVSSGFSKVNLELHLGEYVVITGESGSGKSTLLNVISGLDSYEEGEMYINGEETSHYGEEEFENYRKTYIGNIFQEFNLVNSYSVYQNIELVLLLNGFKKKDIKERVLKLIKDVDLYKFRNTKVSKLSGGQKQRVAIARALAKNTPIIIADEPTGNLDLKSAESIFKILSEVAKDKLVVIVTHNYEQVEKYATRKIEMHDGKIREDIELKKYQAPDTVVYNYGSLTFLNKIRLGLRNTFNIFLKFSLTFFVFLFVVCAFMFEYASFKNAEYEESTYGFNEFFNNIDGKRLVVKKSDNSIMSDNDINAIANVSHINLVEKNDLLLDSYYSLQSDNDNYYFYGTIEHASTLDHVDEGRLPENDNEVVYYAYKYDYYFTEEKESVFNANYRIVDNYSKDVLDVNSLKIVGVIYYDTLDQNEKIYLSDYQINKLSHGNNQFFSNTSIIINNVVYSTNKFDSYIHIMPSNNVPEGEAVIADYISYYCNNEKCLNTTIDINVENNYYEESGKVKITNICNKNNFNKLTGYKDYNNYEETIFISKVDYEKLFNADIYQLSVFVDKNGNIDNVKNELKSMGYTILAIKDVIVNEASTAVAVIKLFKLIVTVILFIVMFFIAYFVIKLIQKSKNVYYATVRILGGTKKIVKDLITIELYTIFHLTFITFMIFISLIHYNVIKVETLSEIESCLFIKDYLIIYLILIIMCFLISFRYSRKMFKASAMKVYNEEV